MKLHKKKLEIYRIIIDNVERMVEAYSLSDALYHARYLRNKSKEVKK